GAVIRLGSSEVTIWHGAWAVDERAEPGGPGAGGPLVEMKTPAAEPLGLPGDLSLRHAKVADGTCWAMAEGAVVAYDISATAVRLPIASGHMLMSTTPGGRGKLVVNTVPLEGATKTKPEVVVWDLERPEAEPVRASPPPGSFVSSSVAVREDSFIAPVKSKEKWFVIRFDATNGKEIRRTETAQSIHALTWMRNERFAAANSKGIEVFAADGRREWTLPTPFPALFLAESPKGSELGAMDRDRNLLLIRTQPEPHAAERLSGPEDSERLQFSHDGEILYALSLTRPATAVTVRDGVRADLKATFPTNPGAAGPIVGAISPNGSEALIVRNHKLQRWSIAARLPIGPARPVTAKRATYAGDDHLATVEEGCLLVRRLRSSTPAAPPTGSDPKTNVLSRREFSE
ncbi:MAG TPA: hypothetical protein VNC50_20375, partial [Planctomycetia bacterium]|nr:hypothetical protein [Planctomycetia bacterium]